jgi:poly(A) polymerase
MGFFPRLLYLIKNHILSFTHHSSRIIARDQHTISHRDISKNALKVLSHLRVGGFEAFLVGGGVRDILLDNQPKDFDIATNAHPEQVHKLFRNALLIGRRFRLVHVRFGREVIEVATFRANHSHQHNQSNSHQSESGMLLRDNVYGTIEEDAQRRDFTINALYYNINNFCIYDFTNGLQDIEKRVIRMIGDPVARYREDPVRMLRAMRFAAKLNFTIDQNTAAPIEELGILLADIPTARMFEEVTKLLLTGQGEQTYRLLRQYGLFQYLFPATDHSIKQSQSTHNLTENMVLQTLINADERVTQGKPVTPAFLFAALLWYPLQECLAKFHNMEPVPALHQAAQDVIQKQLRSTSIPRRFSTPMKEIWHLQLRLLRRNGNRAQQLLAHKRFRASYDLLLIRQASGEDLGRLGEWWTEFQHSGEQRQEKMVKALQEKRKRNTKKTETVRGKQ